MTLTLIVIYCRSTFKCILGRSFLARLDVVTSSVHLKVAYDNEKIVSVTVNADLQEARRIRRAIYKNIHLVVNVKKQHEFNLNAHKYEGRPTPNLDTNLWEARSSNEFYLDAHEEEVIPTLDNEFKSVQLGENSAITVKIGFMLSPEVRFVLINCLLENTNIFCWCKP